MFKNMKKLVIHLLCSCLIVGSMSLFPAATIAAGPTSVAVTVPDCTTAATTAAKLVTKSTTYESKNAVAGDQITVTFTKGITTASTICITAGTSSVAAGVKPLVNATTIPAGATVTLAYDGSQYKVIENFTLLESLTNTLGNGSAKKQTIAIPVGTTWVKITGLYDSQTKVDGYGDSFSAAASGSVELLSSDESVIESISGSSSRSTAIIQNLGVNYPEARYFRITRNTKSNSSDGSTVTATASPTVNCYSVSGYLPVITSNLPSYQPKGNDL